MIKREQFSFGDIKSNNPFLALVNNGFKVIFQIRCQFDFIKVIIMTGVNSCHQHRYQVKK